jgi:metal-responsive CopG/Arc/MetJ family transcriptional regulator
MIMARTKYHITPESGRLSVTLNKRQLKEFKKMSIEFETSIDDILQMAIETFIKKYNDISIDEMDEIGLKAMIQDDR